MKRCPNCGFLMLGNTCWAFACYGRKVEKAITAKKSGQNINIVHETSFWECLQGGLS